MALYLLDCPCGERHTVGEQQAGGQITCKCGQVLSVPTLRKLRHLPQPTTDVPTQAKAAPAWGFRSQVASLGGVIALVLAGIALWGWLTIPKVPVWEDLRAQFEQQQAQAIKIMTPTDGFMALERQYRPMAENGFPEVPIFDPYRSAEVAAEKRWLASIAGIAATVVALVTGVLASALPGRR